MYLGWMEVQINKLNKPINDMTLGDQYIIQCRYNTLNRITPSNSEKYNTIEYKSLIEIGRKYIEERGVSEFSNYFQGDQYFVELWTAHIIFEYGDPGPSLKSECIEIIKKYSDNPLSPKTSIEEQEWLKRMPLI